MPRKGCNCQNLAYCLRDQLRTANLADCAVAKHHMGAADGDIAVAPIRGNKATKRYFLHRIAAAHGPVPAGGVG